MLLSGWSIPLAFLKLSRAEANLTRNSQDEVTRRDLPEMVRRDVILIITPSEAAPVSDAPMC